MWSFSSFLPIKYYLFFQMYSNLHISSEKRLLLFPEDLWPNPPLHTAPLYKHNIFLWRRMVYLNQVLPNLPTKLPPRDRVGFIILSWRVFRFHSISGSMAVLSKVNVCLSKAEDPEEWNATYLSNEIIIIMEVES